MPVPLPRDCREPKRSGKWTQRLKQMGVPHTTGDRLVARHKTLLVPTRNQPTGLVSEITAGEIIALVKKMNPMLKGKLTSSVVIEWFVDEVRRVYMVTKNIDSECTSSKQTTVLFECADSSDNAPGALLA